MTTISAIVISYNTRPMTLDCLHALQESLSALNSEIIVVDNASTDDSVESIRGAFPRLRIIQNSENLGFAAANNQAMKIAAGEFFLLLNSDAFLKPGAVDRLIEEMRRNPRLVMAGPQLILADGKPQLSPSWVPSPLNVFKTQLWINAIQERLFGTTSRLTVPTLLPRQQFLSGACLLVRRTLFEQIGGFDERFFFYGEDSDWQYRAHQHGQIGFFPEAEVRHLQGGSGNRNRLQYTLLWHEANELFIRKHHGLLATVFVRGSVAAGCIARLIRFSPRLPAKLLGKTPSDFPLQLSWRLLLRQFTRPPKRHVMAEAKARPSVHAPKDSAILISAIVVSFNTREMTLDCLRSLQTELAGMPSEIIVVDNASADGSVAAIRQAFPDVIVIENSGNRGFGAANNQAMARARGDFFLLLNSDAFPKPGAIAKLLREIQLDSNVAMVGPRLLNADGSQQTSVFAAPSPVNTFKNQLWINAIRARWTGVHPPPATPQLLPGRYLSGACLLVRREVYDQIGGFDERFFFYCEDADWQRRVQRRWQIRFVPAAEVTHVHGGSGRQDRLKYSLCAFDANELFVLKHYGIFGMACVRCCVAVGSAARLLRYSGRLPSMWRGKQVADFPVRLCWNLLLRQFRPPALKR